MFLVIAWLVVFWYMINPVKRIRIASGLKLSEHVVSEILHTAGNNALKELKKTKEKTARVVHMDETVLKIWSKRWLIIAVDGETKRLMGWMLLERRDKKSIKKFIRTLGDKVEVKNPVFVTDGLTSYVDSIREVFPGAIHIREFHNKSSRGVVYVHFKFEGISYTLSCRKELTAKKTGFQKVSLYEGTRKQPRTKRTNKSKHKNGESNKSDEKKTNKEEMPKSNNKTEKPKLLFDYIIDVTSFDTIKQPVLVHILPILQDVFNGKYITNNIAEFPFRDLKERLKFMRGFKDKDKAVEIVALCLYINVMISEKLTRRGTYEVTPQDIHIDNLLKGVKCRTTIPEIDKSRMETVMDIAGLELSKDFKEEVWQTFEKLELC